MTYQLCRKDFVRLQRLGQFNVQVVMFGALVFGCWVLAVFRPVFREQSVYPRTAPGDLYATLYYTPRCSSLIVKQAPDVCRWIVIQYSTPIPQSNGEVPMSQTVQSMVASSPCRGMNSYSNQTALSTYRVGVWGLGYYHLVQSNMLIV